MSFSENSISTSKEPSPDRGNRPRGSVRFLPKRVVPRHPRRSDQAQFLLILLFCRADSIAHMYNKILYIRYNCFNRQAAAVPQLIDRKLRNVH